MCIRDRHNITPLDYKVEIEEPKEVSYDASILKPISIGNAPE